MDHYFEDARERDECRFKKVAIVALLLFLAMLAIAWMQWTDYFDVREFLQRG
jgi:DNA-binding transcriptional regulator of glucitol operon